MWGIFKHEKRVTRCEDAVIALDRTLKALQIDLDGLHDRVVKVSNRLARREKISQNQEAEQSPDGVGLPPLTGDLTPSGHFLTARQKQIQMQIMSRRRVNGGNT